MKTYIKDKIKLYIHMYFIKYHNINFMEHLNIYYDFFYFNTSMEIEKIYQIITIRKFVKYYLYNKIIIHVLNPSFKKIIYENN